MLLKTGDQRRTAYTMRELGEVAAALDNRAEAARFFQRALEIAARAQSTSLVQDILTGVAGVQFQGTEKERAVELLAIVLKAPIGDKLTANRASRLWEDMQAGLPAEQFEQARSNSSRRSIQDAVDQLLLEGIHL